MVLIVSSHIMSLYWWQFHFLVAKTVLYKCCLSLKTRKWLCTLAVNHYWSCPMFQSGLRWICINSLVHNCSWFERRFDCFQFALEQEEALVLVKERECTKKKKKEKLFYLWAMENCYEFVFLLSLLYIYIFFTFLLFSMYK